LKNVSAIGYNCHYQQQRKADTMSAKPYTIISLLEGKNYRSHSRNNEGVIIHAEKRDSVWYGSEFEAYAIEVRPPWGTPNFWATVAVKVSD
jgi:hypothetical protein